MKFREKVNSEIRIEKQTCSADEEAVIVSKDYNEDDGEHRDETFVNPCPTLPSDLDDPTTTRNNDREILYTDINTSANSLMKVL